MKKILSVGVVGGISPSPAILSAGVIGAMKYYTWRNQEIEKLKKKLEVLS